MPIADHHQTCHSSLIQLRPLLVESFDADRLRAKMEVLCANGKAAQWSADLSEGWMQGNPEQAGVLYVDGHTRVYNGSQSQLPRHYVARQKLCLRDTVDFWVNAMDGQPFFAINKAVDPGLIKVIEDDIVPRLLISFLAMTVGH